jgi:hypothetical protein
MGITAAWLRVDLRRRRRSLVVLALLIAVSAGTVLTAVAGARRGESAVQRLASAGTLPATAAVLPNGPGFDWAAVAAFPEVAAVARFCGAAQFAGVAGGAEVFMPCDRGLMNTVERPVVDGRLPDPSRIDEALASRRFVDRSGLGVGDTVTMRLPSAAQVDAVERGEPEPATFQGPELSLRIVGVGVSPWLHDGPGESGGLAPSAAVAERYPRETMAAAANALVRLRDGEAGLPAFQDRLARLADRTVDVWNLSELVRHDQRVTAFEARCLLAFGGAALLAALLLVGQAMARYTAASIADLRVLQALGMTPRQAVQAAAAGPLLAALAGGTLGVLAATLASRWFPIGSAAAVEPYPGVRFDPLVSVSGWVAVPLLVLAGASIAAWATLAAGRLGQSGRRSAVATAVSRAGAAVPVVVGMRFALESGRGRTAVPVRPALLGSVVGVLGVIGALTFAGAVADAAENPRRFGQTHQLETFAGAEGQDYFSSSEVLTAVAGVDGVAGVNDTRFAVAEAAGGGRPVSLHSYAPVGRPLDVVLSRGRLPAAADEVVLAPESAAALDVGVGDRVTLNGSKAAPPLLVTGIGFVPITWHNGYATGGWLTRAGYDARFGPKDFKGHVGLVAVTPGTDVDAVTAAIGRELSRRGMAGVQFTPPEPPTQLAEIRQVRALPQALGAFLVLLAVGAVGHALATAVRRRRHDVAVLRALGMTRWQSRGVVVTVASVLAVVGLLFGIPLGMALGRTLWRVVADYTPLQYVPPVAFWALVLVGPLALLVANLLAAWPGHQAARLRVGAVLRAE